MVARRVNSSLELLRSRGDDVGYCETETAESPSARQLETRTVGSEDHVSGHSVRFRTTRLSGNLWFRVRAAPGPAGRPLPTEPYY